MYREHQRYNNTFMYTVIPERMKDLMGSAEADAGPLIATCDAAMACDIPIL